MSDMYHYTSIEALYNIIVSKKLRLTSIYNMNDANESADRANDIIIALKNLKMLNPDRYSKMCDAAIEMISKFEKIGLFSPSAIMASYSCSFVEEKDSLLHWSMYGKSGQGVAIGFNQHMLNEHIETTYKLQGFIGLSLAKCLYGNIQDIAQAILDDYIENPSLEWTGLDLAMGIMLNTQGRFKNLSFANENEVRLLLNYVTEYTKQNQEISNPSGIEGIKFCAMRGTIRSYYELDLSPIWKINDEKTIIAELVIGPTSRQNLLDLRLFLDNNNLKKVLITESNIPLR
ncbi:MAG: DUF2971 domain-containing protein [Oscillospiraceae bacterium]|nr:DUF2971 domain-containing protein [Oscillospiraceae bacterium]